MRRTSMVVLALALGALALGVGCRRAEPRSAAPTPPPYAGYQGQGYPPPGYYPPQQPPGYYPAPQPPGYYPPPQGQPPSYPAPPAQPSYTPPQPQPSAQPYNPWLTMLGNLLNGGAPPPPAPSPAPPPAPPAPAPAPPAPPAIGARALELANAINSYRAQHGLAPIPISKSLTHVAETHVRDLQSSPKVAATCNGHSWSANGPWTPCCYTADHAQAKCMWDKPSELTQLKATGFEITIGQPGETSGVVLDAPKALAAWQGSPLHNDVILNRGTWQSMTWRSLGAGIVDSHACAWFSDQADPTP
ncbi:MAG: hypothetical protein KF782_03505 [Labilithrix sp.]|nr:hypothetical protein [Labilithrix sp.]